MGKEWKDHGIGGTVMSDKVRSQITEVVITDRTYDKEKFSPTLINFFFGKNGTGKSTVAAYLHDSPATSLAWDPAADQGIKREIFNEEYISQNVQSYGNIPGVFTISESDAKAQKELDDKNAEKKDVDEKLAKARKAVEDAGDAIRRNEESHIEEIWKLTEGYRRDYGDALTYLRNKSKYVELLAGKTPEEQSPEKLDALYHTVYGGEEKPKYEFYGLLSQINIPDSPLTGEPIISHSDAPFAKFVQRLGNLDWVKAGHDQYHANAEGKCPYCQNSIPDDFEENLKACFDEQYKEELASFNSFCAAYKSALNSIYQIADANRKNTYPSPLQATYSDKFAVFMEKAGKNNDLLKKKQAEPSIKVELEDLSPLIAEMDKIAAEINKAIKEYKDILADIPTKQKECSELLWKHMAFETQKAFNDHATKKQQLKDEADAKSDDAKKLQAQSEGLEKEIADLNKVTVTTATAMKEINLLLKSTGFKGFELRDKPDAKYVYQLVRKDKDGTEKVVKKLSEGERNFIAFLYFYYTIMGSQSDDGKVIDRIVIIDDPVSSMDSGTLFVVASLVREMIAVCYNNFDMDEEDGDSHAKDYHIKQIFCLTHNPYFFREIAYNRIQDYDCVTVFEITKDSENHSHIEECWDESTRTGGGKINRNPVRNYYDSLWHDYKTTKSAETLMNVCRQILEYYFIQMCGYKNGNLRVELLDRNEKDFIRTREDGSTDRSRYNIASAMIALLNVGATGFNDGLYFDSSAADIDQMRYVFRRLFEIKHQEQHYKMMMQEE